MSDPWRGKILTSHYPDVDDLFHTHGVVNCRHKDTEVLERELAEDLLGEKVEAIIWPCVKFAVVL